jgi:hypothetical protein
MTDLDGALSDLAKLRSGSEPIVSLYLNCQWNDEQQRERVRLFVQERVRRTLGHYAPGAPGRDGLVRTLERAQEWVSSLTAQVHDAEKGGLALFANEALGLWRTYAFRRPFANELCTDGIPHLKQLVRQRDDGEPALVVIPDPEGAEIFQVELGDLGATSSIRSPVPRSDQDTFNAGTGAPNRRLEREKKNERHHENFILKNHRAAASEVVQLFDQAPRSHVVLVGIATTLAAFERELPERLRARVIARIPRPREWESGDGPQRNGVLSEAARAAAEREKESEARVIDAVVGEALRGGLGVLGPGDVVLALNEGRVHKLVLEDDFRLTGWRCDNCDALGANAESAEVCPYCAGDLRALHHLDEALVARTLGEGGQVELVGHANKLHSYRGVGAFLRQTAPTGMGGRSPPWPTAPGANQP